MMFTECQAKEWFWERVKRGDGCWEWAGGKNTKEEGRNYGTSWFRGKKWKSHRLAWTLVNGPIPEGLVVCHRCDNPPCCNPAHLFLGTNKDNSLDCAKKGRNKRERGEDRYNATLKKEDIKEIRRRYSPRDPVNGGCALGREFGVGHTMIAAIVHRRRWRHVE